MKNRKKFLTALALVLFGTVGAWAQEPAQPVQTQGSTTEWTLDMPANNLLLNVQYNYQRTLSNVPEGWTVKADGETVTANTDGTYTIFDGSAVELIPPTDQKRLVKDVEIEKVLSDTETPLTFEAMTDNVRVTLTWDGDDNLTCPLTSKLQYSKNGGEWSDYTIGIEDEDDDVINLNAGEKVQFRVTENVAALYIDEGGTGSCYFDLTGNCYAYGNVMSLLYTESAFATATSFQNGSTLNFALLFNNCGSLYSHPTKELVLPATMLNESCYQSMFNGCINLTKAPTLPATTLANTCYYRMFLGCSNLNYIKCLATNITADACRYQWVDGVQTTGTFVKAANMTSWTVGVSGIPANWTIENAE